MDRVQKIMARAGIDSRRACEELIREGRVTVNRKVVKLGDRADPFVDEIRCDGERLKIEKKLYFAVNKPVGFVCTNVDERGRPRVIELFHDYQARLFTAGRLDEDSEGLIIVTNDGEFANRITHPRFSVQKTYLVEVSEALSPVKLTQLKKGVWLAEGKAIPAAVKIVGKMKGRCVIEVKIWEGMNRQVRRMFAAVELKVKKLTRVAIGTLMLGALKRGRYRKLTSGEVRAYLGMGMETPKSKIPTHKKLQNSKSRKSKADYRYDKG